MNTKKIAMIIGVLLSFNLFAKQGKSILLIDSYHKEYEWCKSYRIGLYQGLKDTEVNFTHFEMDTKRLPSSMYQKKAAFAFETYKRVKPDLVILGDDNALKYVGKMLLNTITPVVFLGINNNPRAYIPMGQNITGVLERPLIKRSIMETSYILSFNKIDLKKNSDTF